MSNFQGFHPDRRLFGVDIPKRRFIRLEKKIQKLMERIDFDPENEVPLKSENHSYLSPFFPVKELTPGRGEPVDPAAGPVIGTIRMGYGHYRMAVSFASAAAALGHTPYWFDLLGFDTPGVRMIRDMETWYSWGSRLAHRSYVFDRFVWEKATGRIFKPLEKQLVIQRLSAVLTDLFGEIPLDIPFIGSHSWASQAAVFAGCRRVINAINDNWPMSVFLAEGASQTVQGPSTYLGYRLAKGLGLKNRRNKVLSPEIFRQVGHYVDHEIVSNVEKDCAARIRRLEENKPRRFLFSVGGAGAQDKTLINIIERLLPRLCSHEIVLFVNFGDHPEMLKSCMKRFPDLYEITELHSDWEGTRRFVTDLEKTEPRGIHFFFYPEVFPAVYTTNLLLRHVDFLITKPGELAFYPVPKLNIKRLGAHEAWNAIRSAELGDGTVELETTSLILKTLKAAIDHGDLLRLMCENILRNHRQGIYNGAYRVVEAAYE
jgi:hypothetical protein